MEQPSDHWCRLDWYLKDLTEEELSAVEGSNHFQCHEIHFDTNSLLVLLFVFFLNQKAINLHCKRIQGSSFLSPYQFHQIRQHCPGQHGFLGMTIHQNLTISWDESHIWIFFFLMFLCDLKIWVRHTSVLERRCLDQTTAQLLSLHQLRFEQVGE